MGSEFTNSEYDLAYPDGIENHYWNLTRNQILHDSIRRVTGDSDKLIEIGCGRGGVVKYLSDTGLDSVGVELADCKPCIGAEGLIETGTDAHLVDDARRSEFTTLLLLDVIEHIEDPIDFVQSILKSYQNIEKIVITVPAREEIWSEYDKHYGHFRRYDLEMTKEILAVAGFRTTENRYFFNCLYFAARIMIKFKKNRSIEVSAPKGLTKMIHKVLSRVFIIEDKLAPDRLKGSSIISIGVRKE